MENTREAGISLAVVIAMLVVAGPAAAKPTPAAKCLSAKLKAVAKQEVVKVGCHLNGGQQANAPSTPCASPSIQGCPWGVRTRIPFMAIACVRDRPEVRGFSRTRWDAMAWVTPGK